MQLEVEELPPDDGQQLEQRRERPARERRLDLGEVPVDRRLGLAAADEPLDEAEHERQLDADEDRRLERLRGEDAEERRLRNVGEGGGPGELVDVDDLELDR